MPFVFLIRSLFSLISLAILATGTTITWWWYRENAYFTADGHFMVLRADWPIWLGLLLLLLSVGGKWLWVPLLARPNGAGTPLHHGRGGQIQTSTGNRLFVHNERVDRGRPIIFVHGSSLDSSVWTYAREAFQDHHVIDFDLPGLAKSHKHGPVTMTGMAEDLQFLIERQAAAPVLVGHSMGGMIIQTLARNRPDLFDGTRIAAVVLLNTTYTNPLRTMVLSGVFRTLQPLVELFLRLQIWLLPLSWLSAWQSYLSGSAHIANRLLFGGQVTRHELNHVTLVATRNSPSTVAQGELAMLHWDATDALQYCRTPVLVIGGLRDPVTKPDASEYIAASCPSSELALVEGANHMSFLDKRDEYHAAISSFLHAKL
jgi:pimeloyl-ACP methyl ester carboxylesterase